LDYQCTFLQVSIVCGQVTVLKVQYITFKTFNDGIVLDIANKVSINAKSGKRKLEFKNEE